MNSLERKPVGLRVLMVEDSPAQAQLNLEHAEIDDQSMQIRCVSDQAAILNALEDFVPDLVISEWRLAGLSGDQVLGLVRENAPLTPFIVVTDLRGEQHAIAALKKGANDYVLKHERQRLSIAVRNALMESHSVRERCQTESLMLNRQRLESLALIAGGLGHDLRNVLQPLLIIPSIIREQSSDTRLLAMGDLIEDCARRGLDMVGSMLTFARGDDEDDGDVDIDELLGSLRLMLRSNLSGRVALKFEGFGDGLKLRGNRTEIQQCLLNLALNGIQAMPDGGTLTVSARDSGKGSIVFTVTDTGTGIDEEQVARLFTPFFTTKPEGTGLGLHSCKRIVENHGGHIDVDSRIGFGTRFTMHFPSITVAAVGDGKSSALGRGERILIVDEQASRAMRICRQLEAMHFDCHVARDGASALQHLSTAEAPAAVIIDGGLSLLSTVQTLDGLKRQRMRCPVIVMTATQQTLTHGAFPGELDLHFIASDCEIEELGSLLRRRLDAAV